MDSTAVAHRVISMDSEFVENSQLQVVVRYHGNRDKIMVDVTEITCHRTSKARCSRTAREHAKQAGIASMDFSIISDLEHDRKVTKLDGSKSVVHIRRMCFAFAGVAR